jgi:hypothetical protein
VTLGSIPCILSEVETLPLLSRAEPNPIRAIGVRNMVYVVLYGADKA